MVDEEFPSVVNFFDVYIKKSPAYKELEKRVKELEEWKEHHLEMHIKHAERKVTMFEDLKNRGDNV